MKIECYCSKCRKEIFIFEITNPEEEKTLNKKKKFLELIRKHKAGILTHPYSLFSGTDVKIEEYFHRKCLEETYNQFKKLSKNMPHKEALYQSLK